MPRRHEIRLAASVVVKLQDVLWHNPPNVLGLPCICSTPDLHSGECQRVRSLSLSIISWSNRNAAKEQTINGLQISVV